MIGDTRGLLHVPLRLEAELGRPYLADPRTIAAPHP